MKIEVAQKFKTDLEKDRWKVFNLYNNDNSILKAEKEGFVIVIDFNNHVVNRVVGWAPDEMGIKITAPYDWDQIVAAQYICDFCDKKVEKTFRVGFANRSCERCLQMAREKLEYPGWNE